MSKLNIHFKKSKWKSKKLINLCLSEPASGINYVETAVYSTEQELNSRKINICFADANLRPSRDQFIVCKVKSVDSEFCHLQIKGYFLDSTTVSLSQRRFKTNTTKIVKLKLEDGIYSIESKLLHAPKGMSTSELKKLRADFEIKLKAELESISSAKLISLISSNKLEKELSNTLKLSYPSFYKAVIIKVKALDE